MSCEICGRTSCSKSFHSGEVQQSFDDVADGIKERAKERIKHKLNRLVAVYIGDDAYVRLSDAMSVVDNYT